MMRLVFALIPIFVLALCSTPAPAMPATAEDFPDGNATDADECAELLEKIDVNRPLIIQIPESDELLQYLRENSVGDIRRCLRTLRGPTPVKPTDAAATKPEIRPGDIDRLFPGPGVHCGRPIPGRQEFLRMLKDRPSDAHQILRQCNIPVRSISPIRQLPVGRRQLPIDTRQRPVGTW
ncbi:MAG: hypothetical protein RDU20_22795 [Desulfomonilaceae bacterium]|nr:hypothetical protein [Desulfomonilaceae bacterium]